jgi:glycosyltransferase involved in cell wall biosynthesis
MFSHFSNKFKKSKSNDFADSSDFSDSKDSIEFNDDKLKDSTSYSNPIASRAISIAGEVFAYPDGMKYWHESAFKEASKIMDDEKIDAIISSSWPITCHTIAKDLKEHQDIPWIADLRDLWNLNPYVSHTFIRNYFEKRLELKTFENADALTTTTDLAAETLSTLHPMSRIVPILSGYDKDDFKFLEELVSKKDDLSSDSPEKLKFIYAGSLYGGKRDPTYLFEAIRQLEDENKLDPSKISIEFYGDSTGLEDIANRYGLLDIVHIGGKIAHDEVLKEQLDSDVLLLISWDNEKEKMFIPGKIYEYFALKKPVLSIGYKEGSLKDLIEETKVGYHVSSLESTKEALLKIYEEFVENGTVELNADMNIEDYSMENMAKKFADLLNELEN